MSVLPQQLVAMKSESIKLRCPGCKKAISTSRANIGTDGVCPACGAPLVVPKSSGLLRRNLLVISLITGAVLFIVSAAAFVYHGSTAHDKRKNHRPFQNVTPNSTNNTNAALNEREEIRSIVGMGLPYRPSVVPSMHNEERYTAMWKEKVRSSSLAELENLLSGEDGRFLDIHIQAGLSPWIVKLPLEGNSSSDSITSDRVIAGGVVQVSLVTSWEKAQKGKYLLHGIKLDPAWIASEPSYESMSLNGPRGEAEIIISCHLLADVPSDYQAGDVTLRVSGELKRPDASASGEAAVYKLTIIPTPLPDRETLISMWAYVLRSVSGDGKSIKTDSSNVYGGACVNFLNLFSKQLDGELQQLAKELLDHFTFRNAAALIQRESAKKDASKKDS